MKHHLAALAAASLLGASASHAATLTAEVPGGIFYRHRVTMGAVDFVSFNNSAGAWSWEDQTLFDAGLGETPVGWTHESAWIALTLESTTLVTLHIESAAFLTSGTDLFPGFTIYTGFDNDSMPQSFIDDPNNQISSTENHHTYNNRSSVVWAEDMSYYAHFAANGTHSIQQTYALPAGQYSIVLGGNTTSATNPGAQGYLATITTAPEPGSIVLALTGGLALLTRRRNRLSTINNQQSTINNQ